MSFPAPTPVNADNCVLYGFVRDVEGNGVENVSVLVGPPETRADHGPITIAGHDAGEGVVDDWREVTTDADGYWQIELRRKRTVRVVIQAAKIDIEGLVPDEDHQDFQFWAYQPVLAGSRQFVPDPVNAASAIDTTLIIQVPSITLPLVMRMFDQLMVYEAATRNGVYTEVTTAATRIDLVDGQEFYEFTMLGVAPGHWYKVRFLDTTSARLGPLSLPQKASAPDYAVVTTVEELRSFYLFGIDMTDDDGVPYSRRLFERYIRSAIAWMEQELDLSFQPSARVERQDFRVQDFVEWEFVKLDRYPVIAVDKVERVLGEQTLFEVPPSWFNLDRESGHLRIVPNQGSLAEVMIGASGRYIGPAVGMHRTFPGYIRVTYRYGFELGKIPENIRDMICKKASLGPLNIAGDLLIGAGVASISLGMDGVHQSIGTTSSATNAGYGARIVQYTKEISAELPNLRRYFKGIRLSVV